MENRSSRKIIVKRKVVINVVFTLFFIIFHLLFFIFTYHRRLMYCPTDFDFNFDKYVVKTLDDKDLDIYYIDNKSDIDFMVFHGNIVDPLVHSELLKTISTLNVNVFTIFYRGFNKRYGHPSELNIKIDVEAVYKFLNNRKNKVVIYGHSMGGGPAIYLASLFKITPPLILDNSIYNVDTYLLPNPFLRLCAKIFVIDQWNNGETLRNLNTYVLLFRSEFDYNVSEEHLKNYKNICKNTPKTVKIPDANHFSAFLSDIFLIEIKQFLYKHINAQGII